MVVMGANVVRDSESATYRFGYKRSAAGAIPMDWTELTVGELIKFEGGSQPDKSVFISTLRSGYVRLIQIRDYKTDRFETYVPRILARRFCTESDIMIGRYGPPIFQILRGLAGAYNVALIKANPVDQLHRDYAYYFLKQDKLFAFVEKLSQRSSGQTGIDLKELRNYPFPLPPTRREQEAIADALSDADALIGSLELLLAKKHQIKQGATHELLTGETRLPGFPKLAGWTTTARGRIPADWQFVRLTSVAVLESGHTPSKRNPQYWDGDIPWVSLHDTDSLDQREIFNTARTVTSEGIANSSARLLPAGTVAFSRTATVGKATVLGREMATSQDFANYICGPKVHNHFLVYLFRHMAPEWRKLMAGSIHNTVYMPVFKSLCVALPTREEQEAIADTIFNMDVEIAALERRLEKSRKVKQGMMQQLLTGRIRLV